MSVSETVVSLHSIAYFGGFGLKRAGIAAWYFGTIVQMTNIAYTLIQTKGEFLC